MSTESSARSQMPGPTTPRVERTTLTDQVYGLVRDRILHAELAPGAFIREADLEPLGVSRTPIREALGRLASEGFLERIPHRGFRVPEEPVQRLLELYPIVGALELLAGRLALPRFSPADLARIKEINHKLSEAADVAEVRTRIDINNDFHRVFSERSGNQRLCNMLDDLRAQLARLELWYYSSGEHTRESIQEHDQIIEAVETGDHEHALSLLERNMLLTYEKLLAESTSEG